MWLVGLYNIFPHYLANGTNIRKTLLNIRCVFRVSLQRVSEKFLILRRNERNTVTNVRWSSRKIPVILVSIYLSGLVTAVAVFRNPNTIPFCLATDLLLNVLFSWLLVHLPSFLWDCKKKNVNFLDRVSKNTLLANCMKFGPVGAELFVVCCGQTDWQMDGQRGMPKLTVAFRNFTNKTKNRNK
jgi:hypothetical protein